MTTRASAKKAAATRARQKHGRERYKAEMERETQRGMTSDAAAVTSGKHLTRRATAPLVSTGTSETRHGPTFARRAGLTTTP